LNNSYTDVNTSKKTVTAQLTKVGDASNFVIYTITSVGVPSPYWRWTLSFVVGNGSLSTNSIYSLSQVSGGATGPQGPTGSGGGSTSSNAGGLLYLFYNY